MSIMCLVMLFFIIAIVALVVFVAWYDYRLCERIAAWHLELENQGLLERHFMRRSDD